MVFVLIHETATTTPNTTTAMSQSLYSSAECRLNDAVHKLELYSDAAVITELARMNTSTALYELAVVGHKHTSDYLSGTFNVKCTQIVKPV